MVYELPAEVKNDNAKKATKVIVSANDKYIAG